MMGMIVVDKNKELLNGRFEFTDLIIFNLNELDTLVRGLNPDQFVAEFEFTNITEVMDYINYSTIGRGARSGLRTFTVRWKAFYKKEIL